MSLASADHRSTVFNRASPCLCSVLLVPSSITSCSTPPDLSTMEYKLDNNHYVGIDDFVADARLIFANCRQYNGEKNQYAVLANKLERSLDRIMKKRQAAIVT